MHGPNGHVRAVVFDFDGTLIDSLTEGIAIMKQVVQVIGCLEPDWRLVRKHWGMHWEQLVQEVFPAADPREFHSAWRLLARSRRSRFPPYLGARTSVEALRETGYVLALHTNRGPSERLEERLQEAELPRALFHFIQTPEDGTPPKPDIRSLQAVLQQLADTYHIRDPARTCVVSDQTLDADMALNCGCACIGVLTGASAQEDFAPYEKRGVIVVPSIADVPDVVLAM